MHRSHAAKKPKHLGHKYGSKKQVMSGKEKCIVFLPLKANERNASSRIRVYQNARALKKLGWHCLIGPKYDPRSAPLVVFQKRFEGNDIDLAASCRGKVVFDVSDPYWLKERSFALKHMGRIAKCVTTSSKTQTEWFKSKGIRAVTIPNGFDFSEVPLVARRKKLTFCWIGNFTNEPNLKITVNPLSRLHKVIPFDFWIITRKDALIPKFGFPVKIITWNLQTAFQYVAQCHIGVSPRVLNGWNLAKSSYKVVSYMALGLATISTPIPSVQEIIGHGKNGLLVEKNDPDKWYRGLRTLALEEDRRESIAKAGRETAKSFSIDKVAQRWDKLFRSL